MGTLPNARHERFAQELAKGKTADEAYRLAGFSPNNGNCIRLKGNERIRGRVMELQGTAAERAVVTIESLMAEAEEARVLAMSTGQPSAAIAAIKEKGILSGVRVIRSENTNENHNYDVSDEPLTEDQWAAQASPGDQHSVAPTAGAASALRKMSSL